MNLLRESNTVFNMMDCPEELTEDVRFCILDYSIPAPDYFFIPLVFVETFNSPAAVVKIGNHTIQMPYDWNILIGEKEIGELEIATLEHCMDKDFKAFSFNPLTSFRLDFLNVEVVDIFQDIRWYFPKLKTGHILCVPLESGPNPHCAYFVKETTKLPDVIELTHLT